MSIRVLIGATLMFVAGVTLAGDLDRARAAAQSLTAELKQTLSVEARGFQLGEFRGAVVVEGRNVGGGPGM